MSAKSADKLCPLHAYFRLSIARFLKFKIGDRMLHSGASSC